MTVPADAPDGPRPLAGIRVLDLTTFISGPFGTQILADLGAEVIKVEPPQGDASRAVPPHFVGPDSAYYLSINRGKRSIAVDLKDPDGLEVVLGLVGRSDVVIENFRPGVCERLGLDVAALRRQHPELIWSSVSGFGQTGPLRERPAYDMIAQALSGVMSLTGEVGGPSVRVGVPIGDLIAGMYAVIGVLAALVGRSTTGDGRQIDVAMLDSQLALLTYLAAYALNSGQTPGHQGSAHESIPTYRSFTAGDDRELVVCAISEQMWQGLCAVLGVPELVADPRFADARSRLVHRDALWVLLEERFDARDAATWVDLLVEAGVPAALIKTVPEALDDAQAAGRGMVVSLEHADPARRARVVGNPILLDGGAGASAGYPPELGQDTDAILREVLGFDDARIALLRQAGVVGGGTTS